MPLIVLSAVGDEDAKVRALAAGADDDATKLFGPRELVARLQANLRRMAPGPEEAQVRVDGLEIDLALVRPCGRSTRRCTSPPTKFDLLRQLVRNRGRLMTHREWAGGVGAGLRLRHPGTDARTSPTCAARSSRPGRRRYIRTDPGVGYRFAGDRLGVLPSRGEERTWDAGAPARSRAAAVRGRHLDHHPARPVRQQVGGGRTEGALRRRRMGGAQIDDLSVAALGFLARSPLPGSGCGSAASAP